MLKYCQRLIHFSRFFLATWTIGAKKSRGENVINNIEYLKHVSKDNSGLRTQAQAEFIQHEYIQYCYSSGIHKYVNIG